MEEAIRDNDLSSLDALAVHRIRRSVPDVYAVYRFGSTVSGTTHATSDVDLAFLASEPLDALLRWDLQEDLASDLHREVDLVDLRAASTVMRLQVVAESELLWSCDATERELFEMLTYSSYARLNEERRGILDQVRREGRVLGV